MKFHPALSLTAGLAIAVAAAFPAVAGPTRLLAQASTPMSSDSIIRGIDTTAPPRMSATDRLFVIRATDGNVKEITLSKIAVDKSSNPAIQNYAQKMIGDHTKAGQELTAVVDRQDLGSPTQEQAADKAAAEVMSVAKLSGSAFDRRFVSTMVADHVATVDLFEKESRDGTDLRLKEFAVKTLPTLRQHLEMARALDPKSYGLSDTPRTTGMTGLAGATGTMGATATATAATGEMTMSRDSAQRREASGDATTDVEKARETLQQMQKDPAAKAMLARSLGVFVIPNYQRAALGLGIQGGAGVLMVKHDGQWTGPGFYSFSGMSIGAQAGTSAAQIAMILMDRKAVDSFAQQNKFSLNSDAGLAIVDYASGARAEAGRADVVVWSDTRGAFANLAFGVTDVNFDEKETAAYYDKAVSAASIVNDGVSGDKATRLAGALPK